MPRISHNVIIDSPLEDVFAYASDWEKWTEWFEGVADFKPITKLKRGNGTIYRYKAKYIGFSATIETEIHEFVENKGWTGIAHNGLPHKTFWQFENINGKTGFTYGLEYKVPIPFIGSMLDKLIMKPMWERIIRKSLQNLQEKFHH